MYSSKAQVLRHIWQHPGVCRKQIASTLDCRPNLVTDLVRVLLDEKWVSEERGEAKSQGRAPIALQVNRNGKAAVAVRYGHDGLTTALINASGEVVRQRELKRAPTEPQALARAIGKAISSLTRGFKGDVIGVGVTDPGMVDGKRGRVVKSTTYPGWNDVPMAELVAKETGLPVLLEDITRVRALAQYLALPELRQRHASMLYVDYGIGVGLGFAPVTPEGVYRGSGFAGEIAHVVMDPQGPPCRCGARGCLEAVANALALETIAKTWLKRGADSVLKRGNGPSADAILEAARNGDRMARSIVAEIMPHLGFGVAMLVSAFHPAAVVVGAKTQGAIGCLTEELDAALRDRVQPEILSRIEVLEGLETEPLALKGAGLMVFDETIVQEGAGLHRA